MTRKFPTPLGKSTLQNWGNSTCKKHLLQIALTKTIAAAEKTARLPSGHSSPDKLYHALLGGALEDRVPEEVLHSIAVVFNNSAMTEKLLGKSDSAKAVTVGDLRAYVQGLRILERHLC